MERTTAARKAFMLADCFVLGSRLAFSFIFNMERDRFFSTLVDFQQTRRHDMHEDGTPHSS
jgi:hypothetical protein